MDLEAVDSVLEDVLLPRHSPWHLARLTGGHERRPQPVGDRCSEDEAPRFDPEDTVDGLTREMVGNGVDGEAKRVGLREQRGYVLEADTGPREVGHIAHVLEQTSGIGEHG